MLRWDEVSVQRVPLPPLAYLALHIHPSRPQPAQLAGWPSKYLLPPHYTRTPIASVPRILLVFFVTQSDIRLHVAMV